MRSLTVASRPRISETEPKWLMFETFSYAFGRRIRHFTQLNVHKVNIFVLYRIHSSCKLFLYARRTYSRLCLFTTRLNCREQIGSRQFSVHCADWTTYTATTRSRPSDSLKEATLCLLSVIYMHHGATWCLDTHQELQRLWLADTLRRSPPDSPGELADTLRRSPPDSPGESAEIWADWDEMQSLVTRDLVSGSTDRKSGRNR